MIAMAVDDKEGHCLNYRLTGSREKISSFGHPYIRWAAPHEREGHFTGNDF